MAGEWVPFGELFAEPPRNGLTRPKAVRGVGVKMVNMGELFAHPRLKNTPMERVPLNESEAQRFLLRPGDLLFARQSLVLEGAGKCSIFLGDDEPVTFESHITRVRLDSNKADSAFYFYYLHSHHGRAAIASIVEQGAGAAGIRGRDLEHLNVLWHNLPEQRAIAHILGTLDDKIELNRRMSQTLEAMARALFKAWFVDFEPVRAKMEGRWQRGQSLPGLPAHLYDLFPNRLVDSELGEIPEGWRVGTIGDCCIQIQNGGTPSRKEPRFWEGGTIPWLTSAEVKQPIIVDTENSITEAGLEASSAKWVAPLSTVVALYGATAGQVSLVALRLTTNQAVCALVPKQYCEFFNYLWMRSATPDLENQAVGSAQQNISQGVVARTRVLIPSHAVMVAFDKTVRPVFFRWISNLHESRTLAALRDALLPKLISGELRVKDVERFLEERGVC